MIANIRPWLSWIGRRSRGLQPPIISPSVKSRSGTGATPKARVGKNVRYESVITRRPFPYLRMHAITSRKPFYHLGQMQADNNSEIIVVIFFYEQGNDQFFSPTRSYDTCTPERSGDALGVRAYETYTKYDVNSHTSSRSSSRLGNRIRL